MNNRKIFTSESVTQGHPDKLCDLVSDSVLDAVLEQDPMGRVACETAATTGMVLVMGEITTSARIDIAQIARKAICDAGYDRPEMGFDGHSCNVMVAMGQQSPDIAMGVDNAYDDGTTGAGDQGMMFGFACTQTKELMPAPIAYAHNLTKALTHARESGLLPWLRPDGKSQVSVEYGPDGMPARIDTVVVSTQHADTIAIDDLRRAVIETVIEPNLPSRLLDENTKYYVNPTGRFVIGGPVGDSGLTGRKIIVDSYGGRGAHGGGAFSGKDSSKVDRSAAYAARYIAKNMVAAGIADEILVELSYAIGIAEPISVFVDTHGAVCSRNPKLADMTDGEIARRIAKLFDLRPAAIVKKFGLKNPIFEATASYGHFGNRPYTRKEKVWEDGREVEREIEFFGWEKLDAVDLIKQEFGL